MHRRLILGTGSIVIVHGLQGHPFKTWASSRSTKSPPPPTAEASSSASLPRESRRDAIRRAIPGRLRRLSTMSSSQSQSKPEKSPRRAVFWPGDLLPKDCPRARIMVYGYDTKISNLTGGANQSSVFSHGRDLLFALDRKEDQNQPLVFVAHSLGGIVVKEMLSRSSTSESQALRRIVERTAAVIFLGTPHRGSTELAALGEWARSLVSAFRIATNASILDTLGLKTSDLERVQETFSTLWHTHDFRVKTFQEGLGLTGVNLGVLGNKVVPDYSSVIGDAREHAESIHANHIEMCRFTSPDDPNYQKLSGEIKSVYDSLARLSALRGEPMVQREESHTDSQNDRRLPRQDEPDGGRILAFSAANSNALHALRFPSMFSRFHALAKPAEKTCDWLFHHTTYQDWMLGRNKDKHGGLLWIKGKPGSGKSLLMKQAYLRATGQEQEPHSIAAFFFDAKGDELHTSPDGLNRSLLYQLIPRSPEQIQRLATLQHDSTFDLESFLESFLLSTSGPEQRGRRTVIFIDALDECDSKFIRPQAYFWRNMTRTAHQAGVDLNVCISSRHFPTVSVADCPEIVVEAHNAVDIASFVDRKLSLSIDNEERDRGAIRDKILEKSAGVFLWVTLVLDRVLQKRDEGKSLKALLRELDVIPEALGSLFTQLLESVHPDSREMTLRAFQWAVLAMKPLRVHEWHHILAFIRGAPPSSLKSWRSSDGFTENGEQLEKQIRTLSMGLLEVAVGIEQVQNPATETMSIYAGAGSLDLETGETRVVQVIHESVREFFLSGPGFTVFLHGTSTPGTNTAIATGHLSIMATCLDYIAIKELDTLVDARRLSREPKRVLARQPSSSRPAVGQPSSGPAVEQPSSGPAVEQPSSGPAVEQRARWAFSLSGSSGSLRGSRSVASFGSASSHASRYHRAKVPPPSPGTPPRPLFDKLWERTQSDWISSYPLQRMNLPYFTPDQITLNSSVHHSVMGCSVLTVESRLLEDYPALLFYATSELFAHAKAADETGADAREIINRIQTGDMWHRWILLREGLSLQTELFYYAANLGLSTWLPSIGSGDGARHDDVRALSAAVMEAVRKGNSKVLEMVLNHYGFPEWFVDEDQGSLLHAIARQSDAALLRMVLSRIESNGFFGSPDPNSTKLLFQRWDTHCQTALHIAVKRRDFAIASALLVSGASPNSRDKVGRSALHIACANTFGEDRSTVTGPDYEIAKLLLERGSNVHTNDKHGHTALHAVCDNIPEIPEAEGPVESANIKVIDLLLKAGARVNGVDSYRVTPLHLACRAGVSWRETCQNALTIANRLLDAGANPQAVNMVGETPLHIAAARTTGGVVEELIRRGAQIDVRDSLGRTPLHHAARAANDVVVATLISQSQREVHLADYGGSTPLHLACEFFPTDWKLHANALAVVRQLLEHEAKGYTAKTGRGRSAYGIAQSSWLGDVSALIEQYSSDFPRQEGPRRPPEGWIAKWFSF